MLWMAHPWKLLGVCSGGRRLTEVFASEATARDPDGLRTSGDVPEQSGSTFLTEVAFLLVVPAGVVKCIDCGFAGSPYHVRTWKVRGDAERTAGTPLAVRAVADVVLLWFPADGDRSGSTSASGGSLHNLVL